MLIFKDPVQLIVVTGSEIAHDVLVPEEEHDRHWIKKFIHCIELGHLVNITEVDDGKVCGCQFFLREGKFEVLRGVGASGAAASRTAKLEGGLTLYSLGNLEEHFILAHAFGKVRLLLEIAQHRRKMQTHSRRHDPCQI